MIKLKQNVRDLGVMATRGGAVCAFGAGGRWHITRQNSIIILKQLHLVCALIANIVDHVRSI